MKTIIFLLISFSLNANTFYANSNDSKILDIKLLNKVKYFGDKNSIAVKKIKEFNSVEKFKKINAKDYDTVFNPALIICDQLKGKMNTIFDKEKNEHSVCKFSDESFLFNWDLFEKFETKK